MQKTSNHISYQFVHKSISYQCVHNAYKSKTWEAQDVFMDSIFQVGCLRVLQNSSLRQNQEKVADILSSLNRISFINRFCTHSNITRLKEKLRGASMLPQVWHFTKHHHHHHQKSQDHMYIITLKGFFSEFDQEYGGSVPLATMTRWIWPLHMTMTMKELRAEMLRTVAMTTMSIVMTLMMLTTITITLTSQHVGGQTWGGSPEVAGSGLDDLHQAGIIKITMMRSMQCKMIKWRSPSR